MHPYNTHSLNIKFIFVSFVTSVFIAWELDKLILSSGIPWLSNFHWLVEGPSAIGIFQILEEMFDKWFWKFKFIQLLFNTNIPDFQGNWQGTVHSSHKKKATTTIEVNIKQTWKKISIELRTKNSHSASLAASIVNNKLICVYRNEPFNQAVKTMHSHLGTAILTLENPKKIFGDYFSGRDRKSIGVIQLFRSNK